MTLDISVFFYYMAFVNWSLIWILPIYTARPEGLGTFAWLPLKSHRKGVAYESDNKVQKQLFFF